MNGLAMDIISGAAVGIYLFGMIAAVPTLLIVKIVREHKKNQNWKLTLLWSVLAFCASIALIIGIFFPTVWSKNP